MKIYLNRFSGYLLLSLFFALMVGPYDGNPFSKPYHHNSFDSHVSEEEKELGYGMQKTTAKEMELRQQTKKIMASEMELRHKFEKEGVHKEKSPIFVEEVQLKRQVRIIRYILAAVFLLSGLTLIRRVYKIPPGIPINPRWAAITVDTVFVLFLSIMAYCMVAYGLKRFTGITSYLYNPVAMGIAAAAYIPVIIFCSYFAFNLSVQSIEIGDEGVRVHHPANVLFSAWKNIQGLELKETYTVAGGSEFRAPRKLQTKLVIHATHGDMELFEPGLKKTKSALINELKNNAPQRLQGEIGKLIKW